MVLAIDPKRCKKPDCIGWATRDGYCGGHSRVRHRRDGTDLEIMTSCIRYSRRRTVREKHL